MDAGQQLGGLILFARGHEGAEILFNAAQVGLDAAVVLFFAGTAPHAAFG